jgi:hypothetical protein
MEVNFGEDYIEIMDGTDELIYWDIEEWKSDPQIVFSIANAVKLALTDPDELKRIIREEVNNALRTK